MNKIVKKTLTGRNLRTKLMQCALLCGFCLLQICCIAGEPFIDGYVVGISPRSAMVTEYEPDKGRAGRTNAVRFGNVPEDLQLGQKVKVWTSIVRQSYPAQARGEKWEYTKAKDLKGAELAEVKALRKALEDRKTRKVGGVPFVKSIEFDEEEKTWTITFGAGGGGPSDEEPVVVRLEE